MAEGNNIKKHGHSFLYFVLIIIIGVGAFFGIKAIIEKKSHEAGTPSVITQLTKKKPSVTCNQTLTGIDFYVTANDNYNLVEITYNLCDSSGSVYQTGKVTGSGYIKGNTYKISQTLSLSELLKTNKISYSVTYYN